MKIREESRMFSIESRVRGFAAGALATLFVSLPALADDTEIYQSQANETGARPNVLFIMDTSGSMDSEVEQTIAAYDMTREYVGVCNKDFIYYSQGSDTPPNCSLGSTENRIPRSVFKCAAATAALGTNVGSPGVWPAVGNGREQAAQYRYVDMNRNGTQRWEWLQSNWNDSNFVECESDEGVHGLNTGDAETYIQNSTSANSGWTGTPTNQWSNLPLEYKFYTANYINWRYSSGSSKVTRLQIVRDVAIGLASSLNKVNLGLMRYSPNAEGGYVMAPVKDINTSRQDIITQLKGFDPYDGNNGTPLSETLYEAALYLTGDVPDYGTSSVDSSKVNGQPGGKYESPIEYSCQKSYIVYLTDGAPTVDDGANEKIGSLIGKACAADEFKPQKDNGYTDGSGICMDDLAGWMANENTDLGTTRPNATGNQGALTYMIGFGNSVSGSIPYLNMIARAGGTEAAYTASDVTSLTDALQKIFNNIQEDSATFVTPSISVNAFNRAQTDQDLYFSLFKASKRNHWPGNLKKYTLSADNKIVGANGEEAVEGGFFKKSSVSVWTPVATPDGDDITAGGAAGKLVAPDKRPFYTSISGNTLKKADGSNDVSTSNSGLTDAVLGTGAATDSCSADCQAAIDWLRGVDVNDLDKDNDRTEAVKKFMGDPLHGRLAVVPYGKLSDGTTDNVVFVPTNDGLLHAFNGTSTSDGGKELWAYIPPELLPRLAVIRQENAVSARNSYGLDGDIRVLRLDKNQNGIVEKGDGDRIWLFFGMRAGGRHYYGLDVTDRSNPVLLWNIGPETLNGVGQTWSAPVFARVNVDGTPKNTDPEKFVLIFGGGYDTAQETQSYQTDTVGNRIFMVEASSGTLLWSAGGTGSGADLELAQMDNSIPSRVTVIDTNADLFADRMYVGDMGGRLWRFDIFNGNTQSKLVAGGVIAALGNGGVDDKADENNRRFYNAPDVALIDIRGQEPFYNIAIGSGYRGHPLDATTKERFYSIRDALPYTMMSQKQYSEIKPVINGDLTDVTSESTKVAKDALGWRMDMYAAGDWLGEKVLSESVTVNNTILFTTFEPVQLGSRKGACYPSTINRAYAVSALAGKARLDFTEDGKVDEKDRSVPIDQEGIVGDINVALRRDGSPDNPNSPGSPPTICLAGTQVLKKCVDVGGTVRTFWNRNDAN
jgi:type IV pilus assembly protein PilY1